MAEYTNATAGFVLLQMLQWCLLVMEDSKLFGQPQSPKGTDSLNLSVHFEILISTAETLDPEHLV